MMSHIAFRLLIYQRIFALFFLGSKNGCRGRKEEEEGEEEGSRWTLTRKEKETKGIYTEYF